MDSGGTGVQMTFWTFCLDNKAVIQKQRTEIWDLQTFFFFFGISFFQEEVNAG